MCTIIPELHHMLLEHAQKLKNYILRVPDHAPIMNFVN